MRWLEQVPNDADVANSPVLFNDIPPPPDSPRVGDL